MAEDDISDGVPGADKSSMVLGAAVSSTLGILTRTLDLSGELMGRVTAEDADADNPTERRFRQALTARERDEVRRAVGRLAEDYDVRAAEAFKKLEEEHPGPAIPAESVYPVREELLGAAFKTVTEDLFAQLVAEHLSPLEQNPMQIQYALTLMRAGSATDREAILGDALLPKLVSGLEEFLAGLLRTALMRYPQGLGSLPDVPWQVVQEYGANVGTRDLQRWAIDKKVAGLIAGSPEEWRKRIAAWTKIDLAGLGVDWGAILEAIQRRHAIIHNDGRVDSEYLTKVENRFTGGVRVGGRLRCDQTYMGILLTEIRMFANLLAIKWGAFLKADPLSVFPMLIEEIVELENQRMWSRAALLCAAALESDKISNRSQHDYLLINWWFCRQELGGEGAALRNEITAFVPYDDASRFGKAALLRDGPGMTPFIVKSLEARNQVAVRRLIAEQPLVARVMAELPEIRRLLTPNAKVRKKR